MTTRVQRPDPAEYNPRFHGEIAQVPDTDEFLRVIREQAEATARFMSEVFGEEHASVRYAPDKWTAREVVGHLSDVERVLTYRALRIARGDMTVLPGFDENAYVPAGALERRTMKSMLDEFLAVRAATVSLIEGLTDEFLARVGNVGSGTMSARALIYLAVGHELHHRTLLRERYVPCITTAAAR